MCILDILTWLPCTAHCREYNWIVQFYTVHLQNKFIWLKSSFRLYLQTILNSAQKSSILSFLSKLMTAPPHFTSIWMWWHIRFVDVINLGLHGIHTILKSPKSLRCRSQMPPIWSWVAAYSIDLISGPVDEGRRWILLLLVSSLERNLEMITFQKTPLQILIIIIEIKLLSDLLYCANLRDLRHTLFPQNPIIENCLYGNTHQLKNTSKYNIKVSRV